MGANIFSIDLSLRSTGIVFSNGETLKYDLIKTKADELNGEELLDFTAKYIINFIHNYCPQPDLIVIEGLSFNSVSSSKDIIAGNFWHTRVALKKEFPTVPLEIVEVLSWRSPLFVKQERDLLNVNKKLVAILKEEMKLLSKAEKKVVALENEQLILDSNIKYLTYMKVPEPYRSEFNKFGFNSGCFDLADSYFINQFARSNYERV